MHLYEKIEAYLLEQIASGALKEGDRIPNETELAQRFSASRPTVRQALARLTMDGRITRTKGKGSFVSKPKLPQDYTRFIASYRTELKKQGLTPITSVMELELVRPRKDVAKALCLSEEEAVIKLARVRSASGYNEGQPVIYTVVYLPERLCPELVSYDFENVSLYETLEEKGLAVKQVHREIEIRRADKKLERMLSVPMDSPVFFITSIGYLEDHTPIEYSESCYPSDSTKFIVEINR